MCSSVGTGSCKQRDRAGRSGGKTAAASHSGDNLESVELEGKKRDKVRGQSCPAIRGYGDEEQCYHSHQELQVKVLLYGREQRQGSTQNISHTQKNKHIPHRI